MYITCSYNIFHCMYMYDILKAIHEVLLWCALIRKIDSTYIFTLTYCVDYRIKFYKNKVSLCDKINALLSYKVCCTCMLFSFFLLVSYILIICYIYSSLALSLSLSLSFLSIPLSPFLLLLSLSPFPSLSLSLSASLCSQH